SVRLKVAASMRSRAAEVQASLRRCIERTWSAWRWRTRRSSTACWSVDSKRGSKKRSQALASTKRTASVKVSRGDATSRPPPPGDPAADRGGEAGDQPEHEPPERRAAADRERDRAHVGRARPQRDHLLAPRQPVDAVHREVGVADLVEP